jgi:hypothetical protein
MNSQQQTCETDPCGKRKWCIGNSERFICFDWCQGWNETITVHAAMVTSEAGSLLVKDFGKVTVPSQKAMGMADKLVKDAWEWIFDNEVAMTERDIKASEGAAHAMLNDLRMHFIIDRDPFRSERLG